ncbi:MAG: hypothetical protein IKO41_11350 [Lachnospiraceae bacterium]|nr:hypothetical protein [Lachnospiraceae bacterium]
MKNKDLKYYVNLYCKDFDFIVMSKICSGIDLPYTNPNPELLFYEMMTHNHSIINMVKEEEYKNDVTMYEIMYTAILYDVIKSKKSTCLSVNNISDEL